MVYKCSIYDDSVCVCVKSSIITIFRPFQITSNNTAYQYTYCVLELVCVVYTFSIYDDIEVMKSFLPLHLSPCIIARYFTSVNRKI